MSEEQSDTHETGSEDRSKPINLGQHALELDEDDWEDELL
jgi:hypothetical protein